MSISVSASYDGLRERCIRAIAYQGEGAKVYMTLPAGQRMPSKFPRRTYAGHVQGGVYFRLDAHDLLHWIDWYTIF